MTKDRDARVAKLPQWAQSYIHVLKTDRDYFKEQLRQSEEMDTDTAIEMYGEPPIGLPNGTRVIFTGSNGAVSVQVKGYGKKEAVIEVMSAGDRFHGSLSIEPLSSNLIVLSTKSR